MVPQIPTDACRLVSVLSSNDIPLWKKLSWLIKWGRRWGREGRKIILFFSFKFKLVDLILQINTGSLNSYIFLTQFLPFYCQGMELPASILLIEKRLSVVCKVQSYWTNLGEEINDLLPDETSSHGWQFLSFRCIPQPLFASYKVWKYQVTIYTAGVISCISTFQRPCTHAQ